MFILPLRVLRLHYRIISWTYVLRDSGFVQQRRSTKAFEPTAILRMKSLSHFHPCESRGSTASVRQGKSMGKPKAWVFVSHSSADIVKVRKVRNFLEEHNAGPLLFHLISLTKPEEFWPLIEREISERNFFLFCDSKNARKSEWVLRERQTIKHYSALKPIRVGRTNLDNPEIDYGELKRFIKNIMCYFIGDPKIPAFSILTSFGFDMIGGVDFGKEGLERLGDGSQMSEDMLDTFRYSSIPRMGFSSPHASIFGK